MNLSACAAMVIVTWECADKAMGVEPQTLFSADNIWAWWVVAALWGINTIAYIFQE